MPRFKILKSYPGRWSEDWVEGQVIEMDYNAAKASIENGELEEIRDFDEIKSLIDSIENIDIKKKYNQELKKEEIIELFDKCKGCSLVRLNEWDKFREDLVEYLDDIFKPLKNDDKRIEVIMLITKNDRQEALRSIEGLFKSEYPFKLTIYENTENPRNTSKIWNKLVKQSTCGYILIIDSDSYPQNDILTPMIEALDRYEDCLLVGPIGGKTAIPEYQSKEYDKNGKEYEINEHLSGYCFMFKKERLDKFGYWDENFMFYGQDSDFGERIIESKWKMYVTPKAYVRHGDNTYGSISSTKLYNEGKFNRYLDIKYAQILWRIKKYLRKI